MKLYHCEALKSFSCEETNMVLEESSFVAKKVDAHYINDFKKPAKETRVEFTRKRYMFFSNYHVSNMFQIVWKPNSTKHGSPTVSSTPEKLSWGMLYNIPSYVYSLSLQRCR